MSCLDGIIVGLVGVGLLVILVLYSIDKLTTNGFLSALGGLILACIIFSKIRRPPKNSN